MADKEKDLELHIGLDIDQFLEEIGLLDEKYQEVVKKIENKKAEVKLKTTMDITAARAMGDKMAEIVAKNKEINSLVDLQKAKVKQLEKAWQDVAKSENASVEQQKTAEKAYIKGVTELNRLQARQNRNGILGNMAVLAPDTFHKIEQFKNVLASIGAEHPVVASIAPTLGKIATGFTLAGAAAGAFYKVIQAGHAEAMKAQQDMSAYGESIYKIKEQLGVGGQDAILLNDIVKLDGTNVDGLVKMIANLRLALDTNNEAGQRAERTLASYGETLVDTDGKAKGFMQILEAIANAYAKAVAQDPAKGLEVMSNTLGAKGIQFTSFFSSFSQHAETSQNIVRAVGDISDSIHALNDESNRANLQYEEQNKVLHATLIPGLYEAAALKKRLAEQTTVKFGNTEEIKNYAEGVATLEKLHVAVNAAIDAGGRKLKSFFSGYDINPDAWIFRVLGIDKDLKKALNDAQADVKKFQDSVNKPKNTPNINDTATYLQEQAKAKANAALDKMIWESKASDYDKEIAKLNEVAEAKRKECADELKIQEYVASEKAKIDQKYEEKARKEAEAKQNSANQAVERAKKEAEARLQATRQASEQIQNVFRTETQRRIAEIEKQKQAWIKAGADELQATLAAEKQKREARMSEAERTMRENIKLIKLMQKEEAKGGDWEARVMAKKDRWYLKDMGANMGDVTALQRYGLDLVNRLADSKSRIFGGFAGSEVNNINNNTTVNIDRPVFTDETLVNMLLERLTDKLVPVMKQAFGSEVSNSIG